MPLPKEMMFHPSPNFQQAVANLNAGLVQAGERAQKPMTPSQTINEVTLPLFNLLSNYIRISQAETLGYFLGMFNHFYEQQQASADDNIILAVDPELADEVDESVTAAQATIKATRKFISAVQQYLSENKPAKYTGDDPDIRKAVEEKTEQNQSLREEALRILSMLQDCHDDLGQMFEAINSAVYESEEGEGEEEVEEEEEGEVEGEGTDDEVALPYESVIGD